MMPLLGLVRDILEVWCYAVICSDGKLDDGDQLLGGVVNDGRERERMIISVGSGVRAILGIKIALPADQYLHICPDKAHSWR